MIILLATFGWLTRVIIYHYYSFKESKMTKKQLIKRAGKIRVVLQRIEKAEKQKVAKQSLYEELDSLLGTEVL